MMCCVLILRKGQSATENTKTRTTKLSAPPLLSHHETARTHTQLHPSPQAQRATLTTPPAVSETQSPHSPLPPQPNQATPLPTGVALPITQQCLLRQLNSLHSSEAQMQQALPMRQTRPQSLVLAHMVVLLISL